VKRTFIVLADEKVRFLFYGMRAYGTVRVTVFEALLILPDWSTARTS
jgi:hypothetical protein